MNCLEKNFFFFFFDITYLIFNVVLYEFLWNYSCGRLFRCEPAAGIRLDGAKDETGKHCPDCETPNSVKRRPFCRRTSVCSAVILVFVCFEMEMNKNDFEFLNLASKWVKLWAGVSLLWCDSIDGRENKQKHVVMSHDPPSFFRMCVFMDRDHHVTVTWPPHVLPSRLLFVPGTLRWRSFHLRRLDREAAQPAGELTRRPAVQIYYHYYLLF